MVTTTEDIIWRVVDDEALILNTSNGFYFSMNGTATEAWCLLTEGKSIDEVARVIADRYDVDVAAAKADVESLLADLKQEQILE